MRGATMHVWKPHDASPATPATGPGNHAQQPSQSRTKPDKTTPSKKKSTPPTPSPAAGKITATASDSHTFTTTTPLLDGARYWLNNDANPTTTIATVWSSGSSAWALRSTIGAAAKLTVMGDRFQKPQKRASQAPPISERIPPVSNRPASLAKPHRAIPPAGPHWQGQGPSSEISGPISKNGAVLQRPRSHRPALALLGRGGELCRNLGDAVDQAAWLAGISMTSTPFWNLTPWTTLGNWFSPFNRRHVFAAAVTSLKTISLAVFADSDPFVRTVR